MSKTLLLRETQNSSQLHTVLRERLRESLVTQPPGKRVSSERILAKEFGVSTATVSRALQELQQEGILRRIPGKGTYLALLGSQDSTAHTAQPESPLPENTDAKIEQRVSTASVQPGFIMSAAERYNAAPYNAREAKLNAWVIVQLEPHETRVDRNSEFWPQRIVSRLEYRITSQGGKVKTALGHTLSEEQCVAAWQTALDEGINCVFFVVNERNPLVDVWTEQFIQRRMKSGHEREAPAIVQISLSELQPAYFDTISYDGEWGTYLATDHLTSLGHRDIAFLTPAIESHWLQNRIRGFHRALRASGMTVPRESNDFGVVRTPPVAEGPDMWEKAGQDAAEHMVGNTSFTAVLTANDQMATSFIQRCAELGRTVPDSLSVVGYDDRFNSAMQGLTTIHPPIEEIADAALQVAERRLGESSSQDHIHLMLKPTLMVRGTTRSV